MREKIKILLINPPRNLKNEKEQYYSPPIGLAYIASYNISVGNEVDVIDLSVEEIDIKYYLKSNSPDIVGISCMFAPSVSNSLRIAKIAKEQNTERVVIGGHHATMIAGELKRFDFIDDVIIGEGEKVLNGDYSSIDDLDTLPFPSWDLLPMSSYFKIKRNSLTKHYRHISMITSRGCPYKCSFCSSSLFWGRKWKARSAENVLEEVKVLVKEYKIKEISFEDDNISFDKERFTEICEGLCDYNLTWNTPNGIHINNLDYGLLKLMNKSGCNRLNFGIESGSQAMLDNMNKKQSLSKVKEVVANSKKAGINTLGYFIVGLTGEKEETISESIEFAKGIRLDDIAVFIATPFPGTEFYDQCKVTGSLDFEDDIESKVIFKTDLDLLSQQQRFYSEFYKNKILTDPLYCLKRVIKNPKLILKMGRINQ